jgi:hypothetical protein
MEVGQDVGEVSFGITHFAQIGERKIFPWVDEKEGHEVSSGACAKERASSDVQQGGRITRA